MLTKSTDWQSVEKVCKPRSKLASKGAYMDVSDRRMQVQLTQEARIASDFSYIRAILAVVGFVSALRPPHVNAAVCSYL